MANYPLHVSLALQKRPIFAFLQSLAAVGSLHAQSLTRQIREPNKWLLSHPHSEG
jgi:hypothetical protein